MSKDNLFSSNKGLSIYNRALDAIKEYSMQDSLKGGVVVGFSGGADSVMLLLLLDKYRRDFGNFPIIAVHVNHMIRGAEADRDEIFSLNFCKDLEIELRVVKADIPAIAKEAHLGIEEAARNFRYETFRQILSEVKFSSIAVAHNATDNLETIILNMMRGAGIAGLSGIIPKRDNIIRPLIYSSKKDITDCLKAANIDFVVDSTNLSTEYSRNYVRQEILPKLNNISNDPEKAGLRISRNLRDDNELINSFVNDFFDNHYIEGKIEVTEILNFNKAYFFRILSEMMRKYIIENKNSSEFKTPERTHVDIIYDKLKDGSFEYHLPGNLVFVSEYGKCFICGKKSMAETTKILQTPIKNGVTEIPGFSSVILTSSDSNFENYLNIYKISIKTQIPSDIIVGDLFLREKIDGDAYFYGGMTHKLKKMFNDRKIPVNKRSLIPIICDEKGILWVPGFKVRESDIKSDKNYIYLALATPKDTSQTEDNSTFYF